MRIHDDRIEIRVSKDLKNQLQEEAKKNKVSLSKYCRNKIELC